MFRILFCGGGSAGHLAPALAVWEELETKVQEATALFLCSRRSADQSFCKSHNVHAASIDAPKWTLSPLLPLFPLQFLLACGEATWHLLRFRPHIIFSKGGYVSVPVCLMGWVLRVPIVLHESDRTLGRANRFLLRFASHLCIGTPQKEISDQDTLARMHLPVTATGNPIRKYLLQGSRNGGMSITGFSGKKPVLLVIGGSQGSRALNDGIQEYLPALLDLCDIVHLVGPGKRPKQTHARYYLREWADEELPDLYALADIVLSRAGASVLTELSAIGKATIIVPLPAIAHGHQEENAHFLAVAGAAIVLPERHLKECLVPTVKELVQSEEKRRELGERLHTFAVPDAAEKIARILREEAKAGISE